ncbi:helix-turn-helix domain-containing protein [uncultured Tateyamaria sp.]|nr:helix-turn-helix domain-containing protein [uncultured Tateyamaria sp.]
MSLSAQALARLTCSLTGVRLPRKTVCSALTPSFAKVCPSRQFFARSAEKWTLLAIVALADGSERFCALRRRLDGVTQKMLTQTLRKLEADGLVHREPFDEMPLRVEYSLTDRGADLLPHIRALKVWAEVNYPEG